MMKNAYEPSEQELDSGASTEDWAHRGANRGTGRRGVNTVAGSEAWPEELNSGAFTEE
jgi:hypothetical protein